MIRKISFLMAAVLLLLMAAGCELPGRDTPNDAADGESLDWQILHIEQSEGPVQITASGCAAFEGKVDIINATEITGGGIVSQVSTCADWGDHFDGSYDIEGEGSRAARYTITPMGKQRFDPIQVGINYFDVILEASFMTADCAEIQLDGDITIKGLTGEFEFFIAAWNENGLWRVETPMTVVKGTLADAGNVTVSFSETGYTVSSTTMVHDLTVEGWDGLRNVITTAAAGNPLKTCSIRAKDGHYLIVT